MTRAWACTCDWCEKSVTGAFRPDGWWEIEAGRIPVWPDGFETFEDVAFCSLNCLVAWAVSEAPRNAPRQNDLTVVRDLAAFLGKAFPTGRAVKS